MVLKVSCAEANIGARVRVAKVGDCNVREWEYRKVYLNQHSARGDELELLNSAGAAGWELVGITSHNVAYLKREVEEVDVVGGSEEAETGKVNGVNAEGGATQDAVVKYRDPGTKQTWSGRGRMPNWLKRKQEAGEDIEEYLV
jgi:DNA-binding protein H-NS